MSNKTLIYAGLGAAALVTLWAVYRCCRKTPQKVPIQSKEQLPVEEKEEPKVQEAEKSNDQDCQDAILKVKTIVSNTVPVEFICPPRRRIPSYLNTQASLHGPSRPQVTSAAASHIHDREYRGPCSHMPPPSPAYIRATESKLKSKNQLRQQKKSELQVKSKPAQSKSKH